MTKFITTLLAITFTSVIFHNPCNGSDTDLYSQIPPGLNQTQLTSWINSHLQPYTDKSFYDNRTFNSYHGVEITKENLLDLLPHPDHDTEQAIYRYIDQNQNFLRRIANIPIIGRSDIEIKEHPDYDAHSPHSINLHINGTNKIFSLNVAGPLSRLDVLQKTYMRLNPPMLHYMIQSHYLTDMPQEHYTQLKTYNLHTTHILAHQASTSLLLKQWKEQHQDSPITAPDTYLFHIPGQPRDVHDNNYVLVRSKVDNSLTISDNLLDHPITCLNNLCDIADVIRSCRGKECSLIDEDEYFKMVPNGISMIDGLGYECSESQDFFNKDLEDYKSDTLECVRLLKTNFVPKLAARVLQKMQRDNNH
jgi:hypothetical protein